MNKSVEQNHIENLSKKRYEYVNMYENSYDEEKMKYTIEEPKEIDELGDNIYESLKKWRRQLSFEFIIEELTKLGQAPCLLYDDNGHFAVCGDGTQSVPFGDKSDIILAHFVEKDSWKDSPREALNSYLDEI